MGKDKKTLVLTLKKQWYDMILSGEKKCEYREIKPYWLTRLMERNGLPSEQYETVCKQLKEQGMSDTLEFKNYDSVRFSLGYTRTTMSFKLKYISISTGKEEWGAIPDEKYFCIHLGERIYD